MLGTLGSFSKELVLKSEPPFTGLSLSAQKRETEAVITERKRKLREQIIVLFKSLK